MIEWILVIALIFALFILFWKYAQLKGKSGQSARTIVNEWRAGELDTSDR